MRTWWRRPNSRKWPSPHSSVHGGGHSVTSFQRKMGAVKRQSQVIAKQQASLGSSHRDLCKEIGRIRSAIAVVCNRIDRFANPSSHFLTACLERHSSAFTIHGHGHLIDGLSIRIESLLNVFNVAAGDHHAAPTTVVQPAFDEILWSIAFSAHEEGVAVASLSRCTNRPFHKEIEHGLLRRFGRLAHRVSGDGFFRAE